MVLCIYIFISRVVRKGYFDPHSISKGGGNAHLKVVCQQPIKEKKKKRYDISVTPSFRRKISS